MFSFDDVIMSTALLGSDHSAVLNVLMDPGLYIPDMFLMSTIHKKIIERVVVVSLAPKNPTLWHKVPVLP